MITKTETVLDVAKQWLNAGVSVIPLIKATKKPAIRWKQFQEELPTIEQVTGWFSQGAFDLAIVTGKVSSISVIDIDIDKNSGEQIGIETVKRLKIPLPKKGLVIQTPSGGLQIFLDYDSRYNTDADYQPGLDSRSDGSYCKVHGTNKNEDPPFNKPYKILHGKIAKEYFIKFFHPLLIRNHNTQKTLSLSVLVTGVGIGGRNNSLIKLVGKLISAKTSFEDGVEIARATNLTFPNPLAESEVATLVTKAYENYQKNDYDLLSHMTDLGDVKQQKVDWLWGSGIEGWYAKGMLSILGGVEGHGKSIRILDLFRRIASGDMTPDGLARFEKGTPIYLGFEDGVSQVQKARVNSANYSGKGIKTLRWEELTSAITIKDSAWVDAIANVINHFKAEIVAIDPLSSVMAGINDSKEIETREHLQKLSQVAQNTGCSFLLVKHFKKGTDLASHTHRIGGSQAYGGLVRLMSYIVQSKDDEDVKYLQSVMTWGIKPKPLEMEFTAEGNLVYRQAPEDFQYHNELGTDSKTDTQKDACALELERLVTTAGASSTEIDKELQNAPFDFSDKTIKSAKNLLKKRGVISFKRFRMALQNGSK